MTTQVAGVMTNCRKCRKQRAHVDAKCIKCGTVNPKLSAAPAAPVVAAAAAVLGGVEQQMSTPAPAEKKPAAAPKAPRVRQEPTTHCRKHPTVAWTYSKNGKSKWCKECDREYAAKKKQQVEAAPATA